MLKRYRWWLLGLGVIIILIGGGLWVGHLHSGDAQTRTVTAKPTAKTQPLPKLTKQNLKHHPKLKYACIIYYAVKHLKIQRWQEVSDFERGWQVEIYPNHGNPKYLVWPDKNIKTDAKQLQPNWFTIDSAGNVTYDSFGVHTFTKDQTATVSTTKIINQLRTDHATKRVYAMLDNLVILKH